MTKITEYDIIVAYMAERLKDSVQAAVNEGWQPIGGMCTVSDGPMRHKYMQSVVKTGSKQKKK